MPKKCGTLRIVVIEVIKKMLAGKTREDDKIDSMPQVLVATTPQNDPNHQRELLRQHAIISQKSKSN